MASSEDPTQPRAGGSEPAASSLDRENLLRSMYVAFNGRDIDAVLEHMTADVDWPNAWEGSRVHGRPAVREYWTRQWAAIDPTVEPTAFVKRPDGTTAVEVTQVVRDLDGSLIAEGHVLHVYVFGGDLVARMDVEEL